MPKLVYAPAFTLLATLALATATTCVTASHAQTISAKDVAITTLHTFDSTYGSYPVGALVQASNGDFYGTTFDGGLFAQNPAGYGTIFRINPVTHRMLTIFKFNGANGQNPSAGLIQAADGNFYGTTARGGTYSAGTVFRFSPAGQMKVLHHFTNEADGGGPNPGVVQGTDGNFYGITLYGPHTRGTLFKMTPSGTLTVLHKFDKATGADPRAGVVQGRDGAFYGTTEKGGANDKGVVYRVRPDGSYTVLHSFDGRYGASSETALVAGPDGYFYGTTNVGGIVDDSTPNGYGTIFKISPTGTFTSLYAFSNNGHGVGLYAPLYLGSDGNLYGATSTDTAPTFYGTIFRLTPDGMLTTLYKFKYVNGAVHGATPVAGLTEGNDGALYGVTEDGGILNGKDAYGTIYKLTLP